jgi:hypothetical protein
MQLNENGGFVAKVSRKFAKYKVSVLITFARNVIKMTAKNPTDYKTPAPDLALVTAAVDALEVAAEDALERGRMAIAVRNAKHTELLALLQQLANYVQAHCKNDVPTLLSSGFEPIRGRGPVEQVLAPSYVSLKRNHASGNLDLRFGKVGNARSYSVQLATAPEGPWKDELPSTSTRVSIHNVTPGTIYWSRVRANGAGGTSDWTAPASVMAV